MNRKLATLYGALLASVIIAAPAYAQSSGTSGSGGNDANGSSSTMMPKPQGSAAPEAAPSQQPKSGASTAEQTCAAGQKDCDQGKMGQQKTGAATSKEQPKQQTGQATSTEKPKQQMGQAATSEQPKTSEATTTTKPKQQTGAATQQQTGQGSSTTAATAGTSNETTASINVTDQQRTEIKQVITETKVEPAQVDFDVNVGVAIPKKVHLYKLPPRIVKLVPSYEGYEYFVLADGRIVIVEPDTMKVVYILT
jgi:Protein of unknown function (DUF1236)